MADDQWRSRSRSRARRRASSGSAGVRIAAGPGSRPGWSPRIGLGVGRRFEWRVPGGGRPRTWRPSRPARSQGSATRSGGTGRVALRSVLPPRRGGADRLGPSRIGRRVSEGCLRRATLGHSREMGRPVPIRGRPSDPSATPLPGCSSKGLNHATGGRDDGGWASTALSPSAGSVREGESRLLTRLPLCQSIISYAPPRQGKRPRDRSRTDLRRRRAARSKVPGPSRAPHPAEAAGRVKPYFNPGNRAIGRGVLRVRPRTRGTHPHPSQSEEPISPEAAGTPLAARAPPALRSEYV